jgi:hypothetical protein
MQISLAESTDWAEAILNPEMQRLDSMNDLLWGSSSTMRTSGELALTSTIQSFFDCHTGVRLAI